MAAFYENSVRVNVEFLRASQAGAGRVIRFNHRPDAVPAQLQGRISPGDWSIFMKECDILASKHPYVQTPKAKDYGKWAACFGVGSVIGIFCANPDVGDYGEWENDAKEVISQYRLRFESAGCTISLQKGRDYWIQIDLTTPPPVFVMQGEPPLESKLGGPPLSPFQSMKGMDVSSLRRMDLSIKRSDSNTNKQAKRSPSLSTIESSTPGAHKEQ